MSCLSLFIISNIKLRFIIDLLHVLNIDMPNELLNIVLFMNCFKQISIKDVI